jgi:anaerobic magnesium-protoporphyrin IX monomethyl ester cyclase
MKVVLIAPPIMDHAEGRSWRRLVPIAQDRVRECPASGIYMLATILREAGHEVTIADLVALGTDRIRFYQHEIEACSLVGIGATSLSWPTACSVIRQIRLTRKDVPIVLGGIHPTMFDRYLLRSFPVEFVVRGEGELALPALCRALETHGDLSTVPNLSWKRGDAVVRNPIGEKLPGPALAKFPLPNYAELPVGIYKGLSIESSRGCAFDCSFCSTSYRLGWRAIPPHDFVDRLQTLLEHTHRTLLGHVHIIDDEFSMNPRRATEIARIIRQRGLNPKLVYDSRATDLLFDGYVENIAELTQQFLVGAECGYDEGLKRIGKGTTCDILERAAQKLQQNGISGRADFSFILGLPWETKSEVLKTIRFATRLYATYGVRILLQWYCQIPGSRLWDEDRKKGVVTEAMYNEFGFFRNLYLFQSGVHLSPQDIWEIGEIVGDLKSAAHLHDPHRRMIEFSFPHPIYENFPPEVWEEADSGLSNLREVSRPGKFKSPTSSSAHETVTLGSVQVGIPMRHFDDGH